MKRHSTIPGGHPCAATKNDFEDILFVYAVFRDVLFIYFFLFGAS